MVIKLNRVNWEDSLRNKSADISELNATDSNNTININLNGTIWNEIDEKRYKYITTYSVAMLIVLFLVFLRSFSFFQMCLVASRTLHDKLFRGITRGLMHFFNTNPSGRILNRFSKDIGSIDTILPVALMDCLMVSYYYIGFIKMNSFCGISP